MSKYKIRVKNDKYADKYRVELLEQKAVRLLWWTFLYWELIYAAKGSLLLAGTLVHRWFVKYNLNEADLEDLTDV